MSAWIRISDELPPEDKIVMTKIDDFKGIRNEQYLRRSKHLWFTSDGKMYVYYTPTHWLKDD